jgi:pSer/pThr/pTyr-binding forkhead associated (FHA) protein
VGVLITYTWRPEGQLFAVREGKNFIGAENVSSDVSHRPCDIQIRTDPMLSSEHALILCRAGRYDLVDQMSSNGTFLNGELVPIQGIELPNYAEIKTGHTDWTFIKIAAPPTAVRTPPPVLEPVLEELPPPKQPREGWTEVK